MLLQTNVYVNQDIMMMVQMNYVYFVIIVARLVQLVQHAIPAILEP
jgi:hypothetical protein